MFTHTPPHPTERGIRILRIPTAGTIKARAISEPTCVYTHFYKGRTYPCPQGDCPLCKADYSARMYSYTAVLMDGDVRLLELTSAATWQLCHESPDGIRGKYIIAERTGRRQNAPVRAGIGTGPNGQETLPPMPDVRTTLLRIWQIPINETTRNDPTLTAFLRDKLQKLLDNSR